MGESCSKNDSKQPKERISLQPGFNSIPATPKSKNNESSQNCEIFDSQNSGRTNNRISSNKSAMSTFDLYAIKNGQEVLSEAYNGNLDAIKTHIENGFPVDFPLNQSG